MGYVIGYKNKFTFLLKSLIIKPNVLLNLAHGFTSNDETKVHTRKETPI